jgi:hypothetical protein
MRKQSALEEAENLESEPKKRAERFDGQRFRWAASSNN